MSRDGSIDGLCWPRFDSPSVFGWLLDHRVGGSWHIAPTEPARTERRYLDGTNVLQTRFHTAAGVVVLTDFMPAASEDRKGQMHWPEHELVRLVECEPGGVEVQARFDPRPDCGRANVRIRDAGPLGLRLKIGTALITLHSDAQFAAADEAAVRCSARLGGSHRRALMTRRITGRGTG